MSHILWLQIEGLSQNWFRKICRRPHIMRYLRLHRKMNNRGLTHLLVIGYSQFVYWLVVWNICYFSHHIGNVIIPTDFHIFQRSRSTTNQRKHIPLGCTSNQYPSITVWLDLSDVRSLAMKGPQFCWFRTSPHEYVFVVSC